MSKDKTPSTDTQPVAIDQFLDQVKQTPVVKSSGERGRLIFAMDATASRQPTWDRACQLQGDMFTQTRGLGGLDLQLCFYRGYGEFRVSPWHHRTEQVLKAMQAVTCLGGHTQIRKVLKHTLEEHQRKPVQALVFVGDCLEESLDDLCNLAGQLGLQKVPLFIFQEGRDPVASNGFQQLARLSSGAHCQFDLNSPQQLGELLNAVAVYASGGQAALQKLNRPSAPVRKLLQQLGGPGR